MGQTVEFRCEAVGTPPPRVQWIKEGGQLPQNHQTQGGILR